MDILDKDNQLYFTSGRSLSVFLLKIFRENKLLDLKSDISLISRMNRNSFMHPKNVQY